MAKSGESLARSLGLAVMVNLGVLCESDCVVVGLGVFEKFDFEMLTSRIVDGGWFGAVGVDGAGVGCLSTTREACF